MAHKIVNGQLPLLSDLRSEIDFREAPLPAGESRVERWRKDYECKFHVLDGALQVTINDTAIDAIKGKVLTVAKTNKIVIKNTSDKDARYRMFLLPQ
ncbi:MAG: hypothetical protein J5J00_05470 [Deltaproteobacteria bacterium]|nr:hypothetical protein [Deltaproteobacteria bacterium]